MYNYMQKHFIYKVFIDEQILDMILLSSKGKSHSAPGTTSLPMPTDLPEKLDASRNAEEGGPLPALLHLWEVSKSLYTNEDKTNSCPLCLAQCIVHYHHDPNNNNNNS